MGERERKNNFRKLSAAATYTERRRKTDQQGLELLLLSPKLYAE